MLHALAKLLVLPLVFVLGVAGYNFSPAPLTPAQQIDKSALQASTPPPSPSPSTPTFGAYSPTGGGTYRLGQSVGTSDTTIRLSSFKEPVSNIAYTMSYLNSDIEYGTLSPQSSISEFISFSGINQNSDGSATLTGVSRGLSRTPGSGGCVASTTLAQPHAGQSVFILSNPPCQLAEYAPLRTAANVGAVWTFSTANPPQYSAGYTASGNQFVSFAQLAATAIQGAATSTFSAMGIVRLATSVQVGSSTASSTAGVQGGSPLVIPSKFATTTPGLQCNSGIWNCIPVAQVSGKIAQSWLDLTQAFTFSTTTSYFGNFGTITATSTASSTLQNLVVPNNATTSNLWVSNLVKLPNPCTNCTITAAISTSTTFSSPTSQNTTATKSVTCVAPKIVSGGGYSGVPAPSGSGGNSQTPTVTDNYPSATDTWTVTVSCGTNGTGSCSGGTVTIYAMCVNP